MSLKLKEALDFSEFNDKAALTKVKDVKGIPLSKEEVEALALRVGNPNTDVNSLSKRMTPGSVVHSSREAAFVRNAKYHINLLASKLNALEQQIEKEYIEYMSMLSSISENTQATLSEITEAEIQMRYSYDKVHYNRFVRGAQDSGIEFSDLPLKKDPKTGASWRRSEVCEASSENGLTLPIMHQEELPLKDISILAEESNNERVFIQQGKVENIIQRNKLFRYVVACSTNKNKAYTGFLIEMGGTQVFNCLKIRLASSQYLNLDYLGFVNEEGATVEIATTVVEDDDTLTIFTAPTKARYLKIVFSSSNPVTKESLIIGNSRAKDLNEIFESLGFTQRVDDSSEVFEGSYFDFSIENISVYLNIYEPRGVFIGQNMPVNKPMSFELEDVVELPEFYAPQFKYGMFEEASTDVTIERYVLVTMYDERNNKTYESLVPMPDSKPLQKEMLLFQNKRSILKFAPKLVSGAGITVYKDGVALTIGTDYLISMDGGVTFKNNLSDLAAYDATGEKLKAGSCVIELLSPSQATYTVEYTIAKYQWLGSPKLFQLGNGKVISYIRSDQYKNARLNVVYVLRTPMMSPYVTPLLKSYTFQVREKK